MRTLKEEYNLTYDESEYKSGLIDWYNRVIDKTYIDLDIYDVCKMIRQKFLKDLATRKAVELFLDNPYAGETHDGSLLEVIATLDLNVVDKSSIDMLKKKLEDSIMTYHEFEWSEDEWGGHKDKVEYFKNAGKIFKKLQHMPEIAIHSKILDIIAKKPCHCCGYFTIESKEEIIDDICEVCFWQYDIEAHNEPNISMGANNISLNQAKINYKKFAASEKRFIKVVRKPLNDELPENNKL